MKETIVRFLRIPDELRESYWQDTVQRNRISLLVINIMIIGMELFNMLRVLFWSRSGLGTLNNRIYFTLYCTLWLAAVLSIVLQRLVRRRQWAVQYGTVLFALIWHVCMNAYDLMRSPEAEISIYMTAILGLAVFIQMPSGYSFFSYGAAYALFMGLAGRILDTGDIINLTIMTIVALAVSLTSSRHAVIRLEQSREISEINQQLQALLQNDHDLNRIEKEKEAKKLERNKVNIQKESAFSQWQEAEKRVEALEVDLENYQKELKAASVDPAVLASITNKVLELKLAVSLQSMSRTRERLAALGLDMGVKIVRQGRIHPRT